ncbi:MAG TPA: YbaN family protein [Bacteroidales bacterium]|nr:YbaN family protein [Bacteroidales bacterium]
MNFLKPIFILLGSLSLCLGMAGIVIPGLPTTPFLLVAAGLYIKSSDRLYSKLYGNRFIGNYISEFYNKKGMSLRTKIFAITTMWTMITLSCIFFIDLFPIQMIIVSAGIIGTIVMGFIVPTVDDY